MYKRQDYRNAIYGSFQRIMDTHSEPAADIGNLSIAIDGGKQAAAVYYQAIRLTDLLFVGPGITHIRTLQLTDYLYQMIFVDYMRSDNQLYFRMLIKVTFV